MVYLPPGGQVGVQLPGHVCQLSTRPAGRGPRHPADHGDQPVPLQSEGRIRLLRTAELVLYGVLILYGVLVLYGLPM